MYPDVRYQFVCDNTDEHKTNIHHVFVIMFLLFVRLSVGDNPEGKKKEVQSILGKKSSV